MTQLTDKVQNRRTFAIISHPDAGKTTITEKLLLFGNAIQLAGNIKGKKSDRYTTSDWLALEKQRGISVTTSVMQFPYQGRIVNLLDTPGHADFSEDTYRTLTAVDSAMMVIDGAKGVESRTIKLMEVCRLRTTPIISFINKFDRETRDPMSLLDEIESVLSICCAPVTWPIGSGQSFKGIYHLYRDEVILYETGHGHHIYDYPVIKGLDNPALDEKIGDLADEIREEIAIVKEASFTFDKESFLNGELTPVFFGTALSNFGVKELLDDFVDYAPSPQPRPSNKRLVQAEETKLTGFVFKIQANMDPQHRDRIAFMRICSGQYQKGMKLFQTRMNKYVQIANALTFMAGSRDHTERAYAGDIIGLYNHGTIQIGDAFTEGEKLTFTGIPNFAPELFRVVRLRDPLKMKALHKGLVQLSEEGATQLFRPLDSNDLILGAVGSLQFDVVAHRLKAEYGVNCTYEPANIHTARWVSCSDDKQLERFKEKNASNLALDGAGELTYLAPSKVNLDLIQQRFPEITFRSTREHGLMVS